VEVGRGGVYVGNQPWGYYPGYYGSTIYSPWAGGYGDWSRFSYGYSPNYYGYNWYGYTPNYYQYNWSGYSPGYYDGTMNYGNQPMNGPGYYYGGEGSFGNYYGQAGMAEDPNAAHLDVNVPADGQIWVEGEKTTQTGTQRHFISPSLTPGKEYTYDIKAQWQENGKEVTRTKHVQVRPGEHFTVDFGSSAADNNQRREYGAPPEERTAPFERSAPSNRDNTTDQNNRQTKPPDRTGTPPSDQTSPPAPKPSQPTPSRPPQ
jgi:uncharacterized protein (TIGR03000 family)